MVEKGEAGSVQQRSNERERESEENDIVQDVMKMLKSEERSES